MCTSKKKVSAKKAVRRERGILREGTKAASALFIDQ
jgi:hypothetical protein